ncbi:hypothetical protein GDO86_018779 [Hymenochirus boettgeri]|uniref:C2H2-type domain-containing protein n=1 Tax=Hymenochirus boettgeri TaxID=247094 RepID=A0A8T2IHA4_9PIPI|nr:hypothetical protein GDO86_018779 [Hymenochirus boettgeri]
MELQGSVELRQQDGGSGTAVESEEVVSVGGTQCPIPDSGWPFATLYKLKRHRQSHDKRRPFPCEAPGCGCDSSHHRAHVREQEQFICSFPGCKKQYDKACRLKIHLRSHTDLLTQLVATSSLTPSSELASLGQNELSNLDISSLFTNMSSNPPGGISTDLTLVNSRILTIDVSSVGSTLGGNLSANNSLAQTVDPLVLVSNNETPHGLESSLLLGAAASILQQGTLHLGDVQTVNAEALGSLASLSMRGTNQDIQELTSSNSLTIDSSSLAPSGSLGTSSTLPELLTPTKIERNLIPNSKVVGQQEGSKVVTQFVFSNPNGNYSAQKEMDYSSVPGGSSLGSGGSARTDYRAIQLAKRIKFILLLQ